MKRYKQVFLLTLAAFIVTGVISCSREDAETERSDVTEMSTSEKKLADEILKATEKWTGDFDDMVERRFIRILVVYNKMMYFLDGADQRGITYEMGRAFEKYLNKKLKTGTLKINVIFIPVRRDQLIPGLVEGRGDIAAANLTITPGRLESVDFSDPFLRDVSEVVITGPKTPRLVSLDDLSGKEVYVRASSSYYESLQRLNESFKKAGKRKMQLTLVDEDLEDADLLEMVNAGVIPVIIVDSHKARFWKQIFPNITVHSDLAVNTGGQIAWAFRKKSPKLREMVNTFVKGHKKGTFIGNVLLRRYLKSADYVKNPQTDEEMKKFRKTIDLLKKYAVLYDFDYLMIAAQAYQESGLDHSKRSPAGAIGIMQVLRSTAADRNVNIPDIEKLENNIHAGVKYLRFVINTYFEKENMDRVNKTLFAFASYNAGPGRVAQLRREAVQMGLDPNKWFHNVEVVAAKRIGRETVQYVSNIFKYYVAYRLIVEHVQMKEKARG